MPNSYSKHLVPLKANSVISDVKTGAHLSGCGAGWECDGAGGRCEVITSWVERTHRTEVRLISCHSGQKMQVYSPVAIFPVVFSTAVTCRTSGVAMPVVVLKQTVTVPLPSGTSTLGTLGTTVTTIGERGREDGEKGWGEW